MENLGYIISDTSGLIPVVAGIYFFKSLNADRRWILYFFILTVYVEFSNAWMASRGIHNLWQINVYTLAEFSFYIFILKSWVGGAFMRWLSIVGYVLFYGIWLSYIIPHKTLDTDTGAAGIVESIVIMLSAAYVLGTLSIATEYPVLRNYKFWFAGVAFIYFSVNILLNYIFELIIQNNPAYDLSIWNIHSVVNIITNVLYANVFYLGEESVLKSRTAR
ncbi:hypothetical protein ACPPVU_08210 [Mucilaginibacter sp. McL0603]|uniref:hypothetical protein n=1 Tax=Mucilaginibacter sp. McL0603 TaxID=3415670 RepID=UPI003CF252E3